MACNSDKAQLCSDKAQVLENVKEYYGKVLQCSSDLKTQACVAQGRTLNAYTKNAVSLVHEEVAARYYGCGLVIPAALHGTRVLDLGSGSGRDCFALSKLVGESGQIVGIDMTPEQVVVARQYIEYHTSKFSYTTPNISFVQGYIEDLSAAGLQPGHFDILVSNCTVNLSPDKRAVLRGAYWSLKEGGELYFSDIYTDTPQSEQVRSNKVLWGEGFAGALHWQELHDIAAEVGFSKPYLVTVSPIKVDRPDFKEMLGDAQYCAATYRLFKLPAGSTECCGAEVTYKGELAGHEDSFTFDHVLTFKAGEPTYAPGDKIAALKWSRFEKEFELAPELKTVADPFDVLEKKKERGEMVEAVKKCGPAKKSGC